MIRIISCDGHELIGMFSAATRYLERSESYINALNVFPVPDGDTGTNMLLTMRAAVKEAAYDSDGNASAIAQAMAKGSLMGARGNSGVILSQIFRGLARGLDGKESFNSSDLASALAESSALAYEGMSKPIEGTILTVIREAADAAQRSSDSGNSDLLAVLEAVVDEARASVEKTPTLLPVLRQAGVVDAGGAGLFEIFDGALHYLRGESPGEVDITIPESKISGLSSLKETHYGYCTEFILQGKGLDADTIRQKLAAIGESVIVAGDNSVLRVHLHSFDPGAALSYATSLGFLQHVKVENMDEQHRDIIVARAYTSTPDISTVVVASGPGLVAVFKSIGATIVVPGGQTMNPSIQELLQAVESVPSDNVVLLPNNPNVLLAAAQVSNLAKKKVIVIPARTIPQGISAILALNHDMDLEANIIAMEKALSAIHTVEITTAVRSMELGNLHIKKGQAIAFLDSELVDASSSITRIVLKILTRIHAERSELVSIYYGADAIYTQADRMAESIRKKYPALDVEVVAGGQPHYHYIISVE